MARTQAADYAEKRKAITKAAAHLFAKHGFAQASVSKIATACDISKSVIFHYHPSKEDILFAVMEAHMMDLLTTINPALYEDIEANKRFEAFSKKLLKRYAGAADSQKVLLYELDNLPAPQHKEIVKEQRLLIDFASELLRQAIHPNNPDQKRLRVQIMLFFGMINWMHTWYKPGPGLSREQLALYAADTTIRALV